MRIFYIARIDIGLDDANTRHVFETCKQFAAMGHDTHLFVPDMGARRNLPDVSIVQVPVLIRKPAVTYFLFHAILFLYLLLHCIYKRPDAVYTRHQALEWWATWLKLVFKFRYAIEVNGLALVELRFSQASPWIISLTRFLESICFRFPDFVVVPTEQIRDFLCHEYRLDPELFMVLSNGADPDLFFPVDQTTCRSKLNFSVKAKFLLFMGGFRKWHGILELLEIMPYLLRNDSNIKLLLVGEGELTQPLKERVAELNLEDEVLFCGKKTLDEIPTYINAADICLVPFFDERSPITGLSPLKLFEYMACAKPLVGSSIGGLGDFIQRHNLGGTVDSMDPLDWVPVLLDLIRDSDRMKSCGENGRKAVLDEFNWVSISNKISTRLFDN